MTERSGAEGSGAYWFEVVVDPPVGHAPSWKASTWFVVRSISGLVQIIDTQDVWVGGASGQYQTLPGKKHWPSLVLQGVVAKDDKSFFDWFNGVKIGTIGQSRAHGHIRLKHGGTTTPVATWDFIGAYPIKYTGPSFDTNSSLLAFETIELTHMGITRTT